MKIDLDELESAEKAMTPAPWEAGYGTGITGPTASQWHYMPGHATGQFHPVSKPGGAGWGSHSGSVIAMLPKADPNWEASATGIALLRNAATALFAELRSLRAENAGLRKRCGEAADFFESATKPGSMPYHESVKSRLNSLRAAAKGGET